MRGTGASFVTGVGPIGAVIASAGATGILGANRHWQIAARNVAPQHDIITETDIIHETDNTAKQAL